jgi:uncharacterized protein YjbI with pentapeptide repeats
VSPYVRTVKTSSGATAVQIVYSGADLTRAQITRAHLGGAILTGANLAAALLFNSDFTRADLRNADLTEAQLGTNLHPAELADGEFGPVNLAYAPGHGLAR